MKLDKYEVGKRYGKALFNLAKDNECEDQVYNELVTIRTIFQETPQLGDLLDAVHANANLKEQLMNELLKPFSTMVQNFLKVTYTYRRMHQVIFMIDSFEHLYDEQRRYIRGTIKSVVPLSVEQTKAIEEKVAHILGYEQAILNNEIDQEIIGGFVVEANHYVIDRSLQQQIKNMARTLGL